MGFFEDSFLLSASEADLHRRMKLSAVLRHMQDAASRHLDALGYPYEKLMEDRQVFFALQGGGVVFWQPCAGAESDSLYPSSSAKRRLFSTRDPSVG